MDNNSIESSLSNSNTLRDRHEKRVQNIRVMIVDDQKSICQQLQQWLEPEPDLEIVATATDGATAINLIESIQPDIVLMDLNMPGMDGFESIEIIVKRFPETKILVLSVSESKDDVQRALKAGATGYLLKNNSAEGMVNAIRSAGKSYFQLSPGLFTEIFLPKLNSQTDEDAQSNSVKTPKSDKPKDSASSSAKDDNQNKVFRQESLERLSSPERLDRLMRVVNPKAWIPLTTLGFLSLTALVWSILGRIPVTVQGAGVLIYPSTVVPLQAKSSGQLVELNVKQGELVEKGEVIATIDRQDLREQLVIAENKLAQIQGQNSEADSVQVQRKEQDLRSITEQRQSLEERLQIVQDLTPTLKDKGLSAIQRQRQNLLKRQEALEGLRPTFELRFKTRQDLFQIGAISQDVLLEAKQEYLDNIGRIDEIKANLKELDVQESEAYQQYLSNLNEAKNIKAQIQELDSKLATLNQQDYESSTTRTREIQEAKREIAQIEQKINIESQIVSQHSGKILELTVNQGQVIEAGTRLASINTDNQVNDLVGMTYFP
ncbi:MAG: NHLP bacteriocin system secretion protein, partial [Cyanobacteria bacterium P01_A01_bin.83]